jgi:UDP-glucuronate 4-epimerase
MSPFIFAGKILAGEPIDVYNHGKHRRDFTYIDDIVEGVVCTLDTVARPAADWDGSRPDPATSRAPWRIYNIGSNSPVELMRFIQIFEDCLGVEAAKNFLPQQPGDVANTYADVAALVADVGYRPSMQLEEGVARFLEWYRDFYDV